MNRHYRFLQGAKYESNKGTNRYLIYTLVQEVSFQEIDLNVYGNRCGEIMIRKFKPGIIPCRNIRRCEHAHRKKGGNHWRLYCDLCPNMALYQIKRCPLEINTETEEEN